MEVTVDKLLKLPAEYLTEYFDTIWSSATGRVLKYPPVNKAQTIEGVAVRRVLDERLWMFLLVSFLIGSTLQSFPLQTGSLTSVATSILILSCWTAFAAGSYGLCWLFGGRGEFLSCISATLQTLASVYVATNLISLLLALGFHFFRDAPSRYTCYFVVQFLLLAVYLPLTIAQNHGFRRLSRLLIALSIALIYIVLNMFVLTVAVVYALKDFHIPSS